MKIRIITLITLLHMFFGSSSQENSKLLNVLSGWKKNSESELSDQFGKLSSKEVKSENEAKFVCSCLEIIRDKIQKSFNEKIEDNLYELTALFQEVTTKESANYLNDDGIKLLIEILNTIHSKKYELKSYGSTEMMILKMFSMYTNQEGLVKLAELIDKDFKNGEYLWSMVLNNISEDEKKYKLIIDKLSDKIPGDFLGICYLDMCNAIAIKNNSFKHPFDNQKGYEYLRSILSNSSEENESYAISSTVSVPFLHPLFQINLLETASIHKNIDVRIEAAWAGAKLGKEVYVNILIDFCKDYRYSSKAIEYARELNLNDRIPKEINEADFSALSEMCSWLSHPNEFGSYPDKAEIYDKRELFWPPTKDKRVLYLVKYLYKNHNEDGSDDIGIGLVGSVTFSLFGVEGLIKMKPIEIYAIHCNWELEKDNYEDVKAGINTLRKYNKDIQ